MFVNVAKILKKVPSGVADVLSGVSSELDRTSVATALRQQDMQRVRDQLAGGKAATSERYHPDQWGLTAEQQRRFRQTLERSHVNLVEPALDRLVNSIHSGKIRRRVAEAFAPRVEAIKRREHASALARLCENAFGYGTGCLVPLWSAGAVRYWLPDPLAATLAVSPGDIDDLLGIVEVRRDWSLDNAVVRYVTKTHRGWVSEREDGEYEEHGLGFVPAVIARGRDLRHRGEVYGKSLVIGVAEATIRVTNNEVNLELLRDKQTQALLVVSGEPARTSTDDQGSSGKYIQFPLDGGDAVFRTPESRLEQVIEVTRRFCEDAAISSGLPLDTFLPSLIAGSDASATAARIRAFPLQQRMTRLVNDWEVVEEEAILMTAAAVVSGRDGEHPGLEELRAAVQPEVTILPSLPESDSETLANWQQKTANFMAPIEDAIEYYSDHLPDEDRERLAKAWRTRNDPTAETGEVAQYHVELGLLTVNEVRRRVGLPEVGWGNVTIHELREEPSRAAELDKLRRDVTRTLYQGGSTREVMANLTDLRALVEQVGLPREAGYEEPWLPVVAPPGDLVSGEVLRDSGGRVVGGSVTARAEEVPDANSTPDGRDARSINREEAS